jgi:hypothetical protein
MENAGIFYGHLVHYILWPFGNVLVIWYIFPALVYCAKKNLATQIQVEKTVFLRNVWESRRRWQG